LWLLAILVLAVVAGLRDRVTFIAVLIVGALLVALRLILARREHGLPTIKFKNHAVPEERRGDRQFYTWQLFVNEPREVLDRIESVEYILHPTFPEPTQVRKDSEDQFAVEASSAGSFLAAIRIYFKDGHHEDTSHYVDVKKAPSLGARRR
jgi:hypothetical protein